jgi:formylglycine-generating enzyme required for sulfatase activity
MIRKDKIMIDFKSLSKLLICLLMINACTQPDATEVATSCTETELTSLCPLNSTPKLEANASSDCSNSTNVDGELDILTESGSGSVAVSQVCAGTGNCKVVCELNTPCMYGIKELTKESVTCLDKPIEATCGDGICTAPENVSTCPTDCTGNLTCMSGTSRCNGDKLQTCNLQSQWDDPLACPRGQNCMAQSNAQAYCVQSTIPVGGSQGGAQAGTTAGIFQGGSVGSDDAYVPLDLQVLPDQEIDQACIPSHPDQMMSEASTPLCGASCPDLEMIPILAGQMIRGSTRRPNEQPVRTLQISRNFYISKTEVTVAQYQTCVDAGDCVAPLSGGSCTWNKPNALDQPITCVDWNQARDFARWIGGDLPTETQWEYAAKGGACENPTYPWGERAPSCLLANYNRPNGNYDNLCHPDLLNVCSLTPGNSKDGLCDMLGNVSEWTLDEYADNYVGLPLNESPRCSDSPRCDVGAIRVIRGGAFRDSIQTTTFRSPAETVTLNGFIGFRVVKAW